MATRKWFVVEGSEEVGPLGPGGLRKLIRRGDVLPGTMVRREDHEFAIRADCVRGLFERSTQPPDVDAREIAGPYASLRAIGWSNVVTMLLWCAVGAYGVFVAAGQRADAQALAPVDAATNDVALFGIGDVPVTVLFVATGVLFCYWLWLARANLPHLIHAHVRFSPGWTIGSWLLPIANLVRPYQVIEEIDRLSAEAVAEGDASVRANSLLLVPWWLCTMAMVATTVTYLALPKATAGALTHAASWHLAAAAATIAAAGTGAAVFLRITLLQERAHAAHEEPVTLHHHHRGARTRERAV